MCYFYFIWSFESLPIALRLRPGACLWAMLRTRGPGSASPSPSPSSSSGSSSSSSGTGTGTLGSSFYSGTYTGKSGFSYLGTGTSRFNLWNLSNIVQIEGLHYANTAQYSTYVRPSKVYVYSKSEKCLVCTYV